MQAYSESDRETETYSLPDVEIFYRTKAENREYGNLDGDGEPMPRGYYYWHCFPGCLPEGEPIGPFETEDEALEAAQEDSCDD